jgi:hypothetical protein
MNVALLPSPKLQPRHLRLQAIVYVRQSTQRQVLENQESTRRQYQLTERAKHMGWPSPQVQVVDDDLGMSGASSHERTGSSAWSQRLAWARSGWCLLQRCRVCRGVTATGTG